MKAVLVTGGRDYSNFGKVCAELNAWHPDIVIHGGATGADSLAARWATQTFTPEARFAADWEKHGKFAGPKRNGEMARLARDLKQAGWEVLVLAFPGGRGTASCISIAEQQGLPVRRVTING